MEMMHLSEEERETGVCKEIQELVEKHVSIDKTGTIKAIVFYSETKTREKIMAPLAFLETTFGEL